MQRGEIRTYPVIIDRPGAAHHRVIVASEPVASNDRLPVILTLLVYPDDPGGLLSVDVTAGWASALAPEATVRRRLGEVVHVCDPSQLHSLDAAIRAAFGV